MLSAAFFHGVRASVANDPSRHVALLADVLIVMVVG